MRHSLFVSAAVTIVLSCAGAGPAQAAEITVLSGNGAKVAVAELAGRFERATGHDQVGSGNG